MKVSILTSGFPNGFTEDFIKCVKEYYHNDGSFVFIASDFAGYSKTEKYMNVFMDMFKNKGIVFNEVHVVDDRISKEKAVEYIEKAAVIWISGGDTLKQIAYIKEFNLIPALQNRDGITIGMSAGSINMAKRVIIAKDIEDNVPELTIYDGIGLVDINVEPHIDSASEEHLKEVYEASKHADIYGIYDNTFIKIVNGTMNIYGVYLKYEKVVNKK
jgi:dipeptidase E